MKTIKTLTLALFFFCVWIGVASAETHIPAGPVSSYELNTEGETYILDGDVTASTDAFVLSANGVTLDGDGHNITLGPSSTGRGIYDAGWHSSSVIKDVNVIQQNAGSSTSGISLTGVYNYTIENVTVQSLGGDALYLASCSYDNVNNSSFTSDALRGVYVTYSSNVHLNNCQIQSNDGIGLYSVVADNGTMSHCTCVSNQSIALYIYSSNNTSMSDCVYNSVDNAGAYFTTIQDCMCTDCTMQSTTSYGLALDSAHNNKFTDDSIITSAARGTECIGDVSGNLFSNTSVQSQLSTTTHSANHILLIGDSITAGGIMGMTTPGTWGIPMHTVLCKYDTWYVSNQALSGERADQARLRFSQELEIYKPTTVTIEYGTNDIYYERSQQDIIDDVLWMAEYAKSHNIRPFVLLTPATGVENDKRIWYDENLSEQATNAGYDVISIYDMIDATPNNGMYDSYVASNYIDAYHPTNTANELIGDNVAMCIINALGISNDAFADARHDAANTWSSSIPLSIVIVLLIFIGLILSSIRGNMSTNDLTNAIIGLMILVIVITAGYGILSSFDGLI